MKKKFALIAFVGLFGLVGCSNNNAMSEDDIGFRTEPLKSEGVKLLDFDYSAPIAGESKVFERSFENAPPMISHDVTDMMEITKDLNMCLTCHAPDMAKLTNTIPVPASHTYDTFNNKTLKDVSEARYNCALCHAPQSNAKPLISNNFKADFRNEADKTKSNLLDILNEGVK